MEVTDGIAISSGPNRGEAAFLGESSFDPTELAYRVGQQAKKDRLVRKAETADNMALLNDKIKTQWDSDTYNYFQPKVTALKENIMDAMKATKGRLTPVQKMEFKGAWDALKSEAEVNNSLFKSYQDQVKQLDEDPQGEKWDRNISMQKLQMFRDPFSVPELKADIQKNYGGNINQWRTANYKNFGLEPSFSFDKYLGDITKDEKRQDYEVKDKDGKLVYGVHPTGERYKTVGQNFSPQQVESITNRIWTESNYKSEKAKSRAKNYVGEVFTVGSDGSVGYDSGLTDAEKNKAKKAIQYAGDLRGLKPEEIKNKLARGYLATEIDAKGDLGQKSVDIGFAPTPSSSSKGKTFSDNYTVTEIPYSDFVNKGMGEGVGNPAASYSPGSSQKLKSHEGARIVSIEPTAKGADTESFQLAFNGKQVRPVQYIVDPNGDITGVFSESVVSPAVSPFGQPQYEQKIKEYKLGSRELVNIAAQYGFGGKDGVERFKKNALGIKEKPTVGKSIKASDIAAKAQAAGYTPGEYKKLLQQKGINIIE